MATPKRENYEPLPNPNPTPARPPREPPVHFKWMKYEWQIMLGILIVWAIYLMYDFAKINREVAQKHRIEGLSEGYFGIPRDTNDGQYRGWRENLSLFIVVATAHLVLGSIIKKATKDSIEKTGILLFNLAFGGIYVAYVQRSGFLYWIFFTAAFFTLISVGYRWKVFPILLWATSLTILYTNETYGGYGFKWVSKEMDEDMMHAPVKWNIIFNMTILRMISFGMDKYWTFQQKPVVQRADAVLSYRQRQETHQPSKNYNVLTYYSYLLYVPLFLTGPIITFNAWISQIYISQREYSNKDILIYGIRYFFVFLSFEVFLHVYYVQAMSTRIENIHIWQENFKIHHLLMMSLFELFFLWFKFLVIWRFARLWALIDGVESPENMNRCVANNYCFEGFWRSWHRSFNQWLIRYIFIPLGGSKYKFYNIWAVFSFVAIWHDMNLNLLLWSWIICLSLMPEMGIKFYFHQRKQRYLWDKIWFRYAAAGLCTFLTLSMMIANLIGYGTGKDILVKVLKELNHYQDLGVLFGAYLIMFINNNILFKIRELEAKSGVANQF